MYATCELWTWLAVICAMSFAVLGWVGTEIYLTAPPIPKQVISTQGTVLFSEGQIQRGQKAWLSAGGQQLGSVWCHHLVARARRGRSPGREALHRPVRQCAVT